MSGAGNRDAMARSFVTACAIKTCSPTPQKEAGVTYYDSSNLRAHLVGAAASNSDRRSINCRDKSRACQSADAAKAKMSVRVTDWRARRWRQYVPCVHSRRRREPLSRRRTGQRRRRQRRAVRKTIGKSGSDVARVASVSRSRHEIKESRRLPMRRRLFHTFQFPD